MVAQPERGRATTSRSKTPPPNNGRSKTPPPNRRTSGGNSGVRTSGRAKTPPPRTRSRTPPPGALRSSGLWGVLGTVHVDNAEFLTKVKRCIPAEFLLIASQDDHTQAQEDYYAMEHFQFPCHPSVKRANAGSVATCALLQMMYETPNRFVAANNKAPPRNCLEVLHEIRKRAKAASKLDAKPTMSSSRPLGPPGLTGGNQKYAPFYIVPPGFTGVRRALLIGVVSGEGNDLKGPKNDLDNVQQFLKNYCGFKDENFTILYEDRCDSSTQPTKKNILNAFAKMVKISQPKDVLFIQYSGHGGRVGNNLFLIPSDYKKNGEIRDEVILRDLIKAMPGRTYTTMLADCCYSGTVGDLPYILQNHNPLLSLTSSTTMVHVNEQIETYFDTDTRQEMLAKEKENCGAYQNYRKARADHRVYDRLTLPARLLAEAAASASAAASAAAGAAYEATNAAAGAAYGATNAVAGAAYGATNAAAGAAYEATNAAAGAAYGATNAVAGAAYGATNAAAGAAYEATNAAAGAAYDAMNSSLSALAFSSPTNLRASTGASGSGTKRVSGGGGAKRSSGGGGRSLSPLRFSGGASSAPANLRSSATTPTSTPGVSLVGAFNSVAQSATATLTDISTGVAQSANAVAQTATATLNAPIRRTATTDGGQQPQRSMSPFRRTVTTDAGQQPQRSMSPFRRTATTTNANMDVQAAGRSRSPMRRTATTTNASTTKSPTAAAASRSISPLRRTATSPARPTNRSVSPKRAASPRRTTSFPPEPGNKIEDFEEAARREAVERSKREAAEAREEARRRKG